MVNASVDRATIQNGCSGKEGEKATTLKARGSGGRRVAVGGGISTVILVVAYLLLGGDPQALFQSQPQAQLPQSAQFDSQTPRDEASKFVAVVLADTEDAWHELFWQMGREYKEPRLVLFTDLIQSGCGFASGASGPFYCPEDQRVYIDLGFFRQLQERLGAGGDFAEAYVIAHEVGHQIFWSAFGLGMPTGSSTLLKPAILKKRCGQPAQLAMTDFNTDRAVTSCPIHLRTARPNNVAAGSDEPTKPAISARATRLTHLTCNMERFRKL